jgi:hypothetical protein
MHVIEVHVASLLYLAFHDLIINDSPVGHVVLNGTNAFCYLLIDELYHELMDG